ncbi:hypothetical protein [Psychromarinibacter halotolerans]|uniref:Uncharacterized protein n=1 Tax=Psychromarinibacter halotolerans TaxID=1775175 RepID=A0ABV7GRI3_9RHOB|nr:hypothetical protein [Psychromarinibacter halotolerans]MDF0595293.1 hypothetical protein [Psychromarinibacter halotolerans]
MFDLTAIDGMFRKLLDGAIDPKPLLPLGFLLRAHSAYLASVGAVMAGQLHELQPLLRAGLEQAGYGHFIGNDQARWERWMDRHDTPDTMKAVRREFTHRAVADGLIAADAKLGGIYTQLYDQTIDYGGHPNERGASMNSDIVDLPDGGKQMLAIYLHSDPLMLDFSMKMTAQVGLCVLRIAKVIYPTRVQAVGIAYQLDDMCKRY